LRNAGRTRRRLPSVSGTTANRWQRPEASDAVRGRRTGGRAWAACRAGHAHRCERRVTRRESEAARVPSGDIEPTHGRLMIELQRAGASKPSSPPVSRPLAAIRFPHRQAVCQGNLIPTVAFAQQRATIRTTQQPGESSSNPRNRPAGPVAEPGGPQCCASRSGPADATPWVA